MTFLQKKYRKDQLRILQELRVIRQDHVPIVRKILMSIENDADIERLLHDLKLQNEKIEDFLIRYEKEKNA